MQFVRSYLLISKQMDVEGNFTEDTLTYTIVHVMVTMNGNNIIYRLSLSSPASDPSQRATEE